MSRAFDTPPPPLLPQQLATSIAPARRASLQHHSEREEVWCAGHRSARAHGTAAVSQPPALPAPELLRVLHALIPQGGTLPPVVLQGLSNALATPDAHAAFFATVGRAWPGLLSHLAAAPAPPVSPAAAPATTAQSAEALATRLPSPMTAHLNPLFSSAPLASQGLMASAELRPSAACLSTRPRAAHGPLHTTAASLGSTGDWYSNGRSRSPERRRPVRRGRAVGAPLPSKSRGFVPTPPVQPLATAAMPATQQHLLHGGVDSVTTEEGVEGAESQPIPGADVAASEDEVSKLLHVAGDNLLVNVEVLDEVKTLAPSPKVVPASPVAMRPEIRTVAAAEAAGQALPDSTAEPADESGTLLSALPGMGVLGVGGVADGHGVGGQPVAALKSSASENTGSQLPQGAATPKGSDTRGSRSTGAAPCAVEDPLQMMMFAANPGLVTGAPTAGPAAAESFSAPSTGSVSGGPRNPLTSAVMDEAGASSTAAREATADVQCGVDLPGGAPASPAAASPAAAASSGRDGKTAGVLVAAGCCCGLPACRQGDRARHGSQAPGHPPISGCVQSTERHAFATRTSPASSELVSVLAVHYALPFKPVLMHDRIQATPYWWITARAAQSRGVDAAQRSDCAYGRRQ